MGRSIRLHILPALLTLALAACQDLDPVAPTRPVEPVDTTTHLGGDLTGTVKNLNQLPLFITDIAFEGKVAWIGTEKQGLLRLDSLDAGPPRRIELPGAGFAPVEGVRVISAGGYVWATSAGGMVRIKDDRLEEAPKPVTRVRRDPSGGFWGMGEGGLYRLESGAWEPFAWPHPLPAGFALRGFAVRPGQDLWLLGDSCVARDTGSGWKVYRSDTYPMPSQPTDIALDSAGTLWVSGFPQVTVFRAGRWESAPGITYGSAFFRDAQKRLWLDGKTWVDGGWRAFHPEAGYGLQDGPGGQPAAVSLTYGGYLGTYSGYSARDGIVLVTQDAKVETRVSNVTGVPRLERGGIFGVRPRYQVVADDGVEWVAAGDSGLFKVTAAGTDSMRAEKPEFDLGRVNDLVRDSSGRIWVATEAKGLAVHENGAWKWAPGNISAGGHARIVSLAIHPESGVLGMTNAGIYANKGTAWTPWAPFASIPIAEVNKLAVDGRGRVWVLLRPAGLAMWDGRSWTHYTPGGDVPAAPFVDIIPDSKGGFWAFTDTSLHRHDGDAWAAGPDRKCFEDLRSRPFTALAIESDSVVWVGTGIPRDPKWPHLNGRIVRLRGPSCHTLPLADNPNSIFVAAPGDLRVGTPHELLRFRPVL